MADRGLDFVVAPQPIVAGAYTAPLAPHYILSITRWWDALSPTEEQSLRSAHLDAVEIDTYVDWFRRPHTGTTDDRRALADLRDELSPW